MKGIKKSLKKKMVLVSSITLITSIMLILLFSTFVVNKEVGDDNEIMLEEVVKVGANSIEEYVDKHKALVETLATSITIQGNDIKVNFEMMNKFKTQYKVESIFVVDATGEGLTSDNTKVNIKDKEYFKSALSGKTFVSSPMVDEGSKKSYMVYSAPIMEGNTVKGVISFARNGEEISKKVQEIIFLATGRAMLVDSKGNTIAHTDFDRVVKGENIIELAKNNKDLLGYSKYIEKMKNGETGGGVYSLDGKEKLISYINIPSLGWSVGMSIDESDIHKVVRQVIWTILVVGIILLIIVMVGVSIYVDKTLVRRMKVNLEAILEFSNGNFNQTLLEKDLVREDEIGVMLQAIDSSQKNLAEMIKSIKESSNLLVTESSSMAAISEEYVSTCDNIIIATKEGAEGTSSQATQMSDISMSVQGFEEGLNEMVASVTTINNMLGDITEKSSASSMEILALVKTIEGVEDSFNGFIETLDNVQNSIKDITSITGVIQGISEQTNLLALNAAIEAARAGEAGRGFSVVAGEIRNLAEESKKSVSEIGEIVQGILKDSDIMVSGAEGVTGNIKEQIVKTNNAVESFDVILNLVSEVANEVNSLDSNSAILLDEKEKIVDNISGTSAISEELSAATEEIYASTTELSEASNGIAKSADNVYGLAEEMLKKVNRFEIE